MATVCYTKATLTSARVSTGYSVSTAYRNVAYTSPGATYIVPYTTTLCSTGAYGRVCAAYLTARYSIAPPQVYVSQVAYYTSVPVYYTDHLTLYSTSCSVSQRPAAAPTPQAPPATSYVTTTTTRTSVADGSPTPPPTRSQSTVFGSTDTAAPILGSDSTTTAEPRKVPVGAIVGGVLGGLAAAILLGLLVYFLLFRKDKKGYDQEDSREHLDQPRPLSAMPSEISSGVVDPQMQEYGVQNLGVQGAQGHQYSHVRQDSITLAAGMRDSQISPLSSPGPDHGYYYAQTSGQYLGHAEIQDSRL